MYRRVAKDGSKITDKTNLSYYFRKELNSKIMMKTKKDQLSFVISELDRLKGLQIIEPEEIKALNYAVLILKNKVKELNKKEPKKDKMQQYIKNCPVHHDCNKCYRKTVCKNENNGIDILNK